MDRIEKQIHLNRLSLIANLVNIVTKHKCTVRIQSQGRLADPKNILEVASLDLRNPVTIIAIGEDAAEFAASLDELVSCYEGEMS